MRPRRAIRALTVLALLLVSMAAFAQGATLYVTRVLVAERGDVKLGDIVRPSGGVAAAARETLSRSIGTLADKPLYMPVASYLADLESAFGQDAIIVGSRTLIVPKGTTLEQESYALDRLVDFLQSKGLLSDSAQELPLTQNVMKGAAMVDGTPIFQAQKSRGQTDVSFSLTGADGSSVTGRVTLAAASADATAGVTPGSTVTVLFHKGPITIQMPGKAMGSASMGDSVSVYVADSQKSFMGTLADGKAVNVDLP